MCPQGQTQEGHGRNGTEDLSAHVAGEVMGMHFVLSPESEGDGRVEVRAAAASERAEGDQAAGAGE